MKRKSDPLGHGSAFQVFSGAFQVLFSFFPRFLHCFRTSCKLWQFVVLKGSPVNNLNPLKGGSAFQRFSGAFQVFFSFFLRFLQWFPAVCLYPRQNLPSSVPGGPPVRMHGARLLLGSSLPLGLPVSCTLSFCSRQLVDTRTATGNTGRGVGIPSN